MKSIDNGNQDGLTWVTSLGRVLVEGLGLSFHEGDMELTLWWLWLFVLMHTSTRPIQILDALPAMRPAHYGAESPPSSRPRILVGTGQLFFSCVSAPGPGPRKRRWRIAPHSKAPAQPLDAIADTKKNNQNDNRRFRRRRSPTVTLCLESLFHCIRFCSRWLTMNSDYSWHNRCCFCVGCIQFSLHIQRVWSCFHEQCKKPNHPLTVCGK